MSSSMEMFFNESTMLNQEWHDKSIEETAEDKTWEKLKVNLQQKGFETHFETYLCFDTPYININSNVKMT